MNAPQTALSEPSNSVSPDGARLLSNLSHAIRRYVVLTRAQADTLALWIVHTYAIAAFEITPYLHVTSAQKGSGKTRLLKVLDAVAFKAIRATNISPSALCRLINGMHPTLLLDEIDQQMKGSNEAGAAIRGVLNCGFERGTPYICNVEKRSSEGSANWVPTMFDTFGPKALAGIGNLWETVADRSLPITLQRRLASEPVQKFHSEDAAWLFAPLKKACERWASANLEALRRARPSVPASNREADLLEPLLAIADVAGGEWPDRARRSLLEVCQGRGEATSNAYLEMLADVREAFGSTDRMATSELLGKLPLGNNLALPNGKKLAKVLREFGAKPRNLRLGEKVCRGYDRADLEPVWARYLPPLLPDDPAAATSATTSVNTGENGGSAPATAELCSGIENTVLPNKHAPCSTCSGKDPFEVEAAM